MKKKKIQNEGDAPYCIVDISKCSSLKDGCESVCVSEKDNTVLIREYNSTDYYKN
jgi:hypothetical protein